MFRKNKPPSYYFDWIIALLLLFVLSLFVLFIYLQNVDKHAGHYYNYKKTVENIERLNRDLDYPLLHPYIYLDNDSIKNNMKMFDSELLLLKHGNMGQQFGDTVETTLKTIEDRFQKKVEYIESFKTVNARITGAVFYLNELAKEIKISHIDSRGLDGLLSKILFKINQVFLDLDYNIDNLTQELNQIEAYSEDDEDIKYFYGHLKQFMIDSASVKRIIIETKALVLDEILMEMNRHLEDEYLSRKKEESMISTIFFALAFIIVLILIATYLRVLRNKEEVLQLAYSDTLTNLPNRAEFERHINILTQGAGTRPFVILYIDLDRFKVINDTLGHDIGDKMLVVLSKRIAKVIGAKNFIARIGGDEFVAIIERKKNIKDIVLLVKRVALTVRKAIAIQDYSLNTTVSIGIAKYPQDGKDKNTLLKNADAAMYHAKEKGRDTYAFYTEQLSINVQRRLELEQELVDGLKKKEFTLYFQPQYRLDTKKITGVEVLVRWDNSVLGRVSPEEFIHVAEDTGLIVELGYYIFKEACIAYLSWQKQGVDINLIAINISSVQLRQIDALERFKSIMKETGINPKNIEIELTERYLMEYTIEKLTILDDLRDLGCRISIDDFGTGYSSMSYLKSLAIDTIKIDKSFILDLPHNQHDVEVSKAIIVLSQSLGYEVIAEGIETIEQEELLRENNCDMGQGYYFAKPMKSEDIITFYHKNKI